MSTTIKVHILTKCEYCNGEAYFPDGECESNLGEFYMSYKPCAMCQGTGRLEKWVSLYKFIQLLDQVNLYEPDYQELAEDEPISQYQDSRDSAGI